MTSTSSGQARGSGAGPAYIALRRRGRLDTDGPPPLARMTRRFLALSENDIKTRMADEGRPALADLIVPHEITGPGDVMRDERVTGRPPWCSIRRSRRPSPSGSTVRTSRS